MTDCTPPSHGPDASSEPATHTLCEADARILDHLAEHGFDPSRVALLPEADRPRAVAVLRQLGMLDACPASQPHESLVDAVITRIDRFEADRAAAMRIGSGGRTRFRLRLADFVGIAALLLMSVSVLLPIASQMRANSLSTVCANNLRTLGSGLQAYASEHNGLMPALPVAEAQAGIGSLFSTNGASGVGNQAKMASSGQSGMLRGTITQRQPQVLTVTPDWGTYRHSANLALLVAKGYAPVHCLQCPGCAKGVACFAYRMPAQNAPLRMETPDRMVVASDANPVLELRLDGQRITSSVLSSRNHSDRGQNLLYSDTSVEWHITPVLTIQPAKLFDNIWLPRDTDGCEKADLKCAPADPKDTFVAQ